MTTLVLIALAPSVAVLLLRLVVVAVREVASRRNNTTTQGELRMETQGERRLRVFILRYHGRLYPISEETLGLAFAEAARWGVNGSAELLLVVSWAEWRERRAEILAELDECECEGK